METSVIYLSTSNLVTSVVLVRDEDKRQLLVYFMRHVIPTIELNYPNIRRLALALA